MAEYINAQLDSARFETTTFELQSQPSISEPTPHRTVQNDVDHKNAVPTTSTFFKEVSILPRGIWGGGVGTEFSKLGLPTWKFAGH